MWFPLTPQSTPIPLVHCPLESLAVTDCPLKVYFSFNKGRRSTFSTSPVFWKLPPSLLSHPSEVIREPSSGVCVTRSSSLPPRSFPVELIAFSLFRPEVVRSSLDCKSPVDFCLLACLCSSPFMTLVVHKIFPTLSAH